MQDVKGVGVTLKFKIERELEAGLCTSSPVQYDVRACRVASVLEMNTADRELEDPGLTPIDDDDDAAQAVRYQRASDAEEDASSWEKRRKPDGMCRCEGSDGPVR